MTQIVHYALLVTAMCLLDFPSSITSNTSSGLETNLSVAPFTNGTLFLSSCTLRLTFDTENISPKFVSVKNTFDISNQLIILKYCTYHPISP